MPVTMRAEESEAQTTTSGGLSNSWESVGKATLTMLVSIVAMKVPKATAMRQRHLYCIGAESTGKSTQVEGGFDEPYVAAWAQSSSQRRTGSSRPRMGDWPRSAKAKLLPAAS